MFKGVTNLNLDAKGRLAFPTRYREELANHCNGEMVITIDTDERCLLIYPQPEWDQIEQTVAALPGLDRAVRRIQRLLIGHATEINLDGAGRLQLTPPLREYAYLEKKMVMIGQGKKFELWSENEWTSRRESWYEEETPKVLIDALAGLSL